MLSSVSSVPQLEASPDRLVCLFFLWQTPVPLQLLSKPSDVLYFLSRCLSVRPSPLPYSVTWIVFFSLCLQLTCVLLLHHSSHYLFVTINHPSFSLSSFPPFSFTLSSLCFSPVALHLRPLIRADVYGEHVFVLGVVLAFLPPQAIGPSLPPSLPPLLHCHHHHAASLSGAPWGAQGLYGRAPRALLPDQRWGHQSGAVGQDRRRGQVGGNHLLF